MPKQPIEKVYINKPVFMQCLKHKKYTITSLAAVLEVDCNEKTIRRALSENKINPKLLDRIAKFLDIDPRFLSGQVHNNYTYKKTSNEEKALLLQILNVEDFPYRQYELDQANNKDLDETLCRLIALFEIAPSQYTKMDFDSKYQFQHDLFNAIVPVINKHFDVDYLDRKTKPNLDRIICELEDYKDDHDIEIYADTTLRKEFISAPPKGLTSELIQRMTTDDILNLHTAIQWGDEELAVPYLQKKYSQI